MTTKAKNDALIATANAQAKATRTRADAESYRIEQMNQSLDKAKEGYFKNQTINAFSQLATSPANTVVVSGDNVSDLGKIPVIKKMLDNQK